MTTQHVEIDWNCCGLTVTPQMRVDIAKTVIEMYEGWQSQGFSYVWLENGQLDFVFEQHADTISDFFAELNGRRDWYQRSWLLDYCDDFVEWLKGYLHDKWGDAGYEEDNDGNDAMLEGERRIFGWLENKSIDDLRAEHRSLLGESSGSWISEGF
jgi:hypothetical protein